MKKEVRKAATHSEVNSDINQEGTNDTSVNLMEKNSILNPKPKENHQKVQEKDEGQKKILAGSDNIPPVGRITYIFFH